MDLLLTSCFVLNCVFSLVNRNVRIVGLGFLLLFVCVSVLPYINSTLMQIRSPNLTDKCSTLSPGNPLILGSKSLRSRPRVTFYCTTLCQGSICCRQVSVCPSVACQYCTRTAISRITQIMPYDSPGTLAEISAKFQRDHP